MRRREIATALTVDYFDWVFAPPRQYFSDLASQPDLQLLSAANEHDGHTLPPGVISLGQQSRADYERLTGSVKAMLGIGGPFISPSVYTALCQGTPVVLPAFTNQGPLQGWQLYAEYVTGTFSFLKQI